MDGVDRLTRRELNRATLARQHLLERTTDPIAEVVTHLIGLQAQLPLNPYEGLWSRVVDFDPHDVAQLIWDRSLVRMVVMRGTIHLMTANDALAIRPLIQPVLDREMLHHSDFKAAIAATDVEPVVDFVRALLDGRSMAGGPLRAAIAAEFPEVDPAAMVLVARNLIPLVQVPPRGIWGRSLQVTYSSAESWIGRSVPTASIDEVIRRYLACSGPATTADMASWTGLTGMREVAERLRPQLRVFTDDRGRELFDLPDAPRPDGDTPAPPRFLPEYDNALLSYADRERFIREPLPPQPQPPPAVRGTVLFDGDLVGTWRSEFDKGTGNALITVDAIVSLAKRAQSQIEAEALDFATFRHPTATHNRFVLQK